MDWKRVSRWPARDAQVQEAFGQITARLLTVVQGTRRSTDQTMSHAMPARGADIAIQTDDVRSTDAAQACLKHLPQTAR